MIGSFQVDYPSLNLNLSYYIIGIIARDHMSLDHRCLCLFKTPLIWIWTQGEICGIIIGLTIEAVWLDSILVGKFLRCTSGPIVMRLVYL